MVLGLTEWFINFTHFTASKDFNTRDLASVKNPQLEYMINGLIKSAELASLVGGLFVKPIYHTYLTRTLKPENTTPNSPKIITHAARKLQGRILLASFAIGPIVALADIYINGYTDQELKEKCYEMRVNTDTLVIDRCAVTLGLVGWYWKRFTAMVDGINLGIAYGIFHNKVIKVYGNPILHDKFEPNKRFAVSDLSLAEKTKTEIEAFWLHLDRQEEQKTNKPS